MLAWKKLDGISSNKAEMIEINEEMKAKKGKLWLLWERLLDNSLLNTRQQIVTKQCNTDNYVTCNDVKAPAKRGKKFWQCKRASGNAFFKS